MTINGVLVVFAITAALLVACGGSGDSTESDVKLGEEVPVPFDIAEHGDILLYSTDVLDGGTTASATFFAPEPGECLLICTVAGHYPSMQGKLVVN